MQSGLLLVDKPEGPTSAQVVQQVKDILRARKVGHLGTLDPFASGLLPLGINDGTKVARLFLDATKSYTGTVVMGVETDTEDCTGRVVAVRDVPSLGDRELEGLRAAFTGSLRQIPPMFSALKKDGVRLYQLARRGESVPREGREITIERCRLWRRGPAELGFEITCSKGTYLRTLAADMGRFLGCGGHLKSLRRLSCGRLRLDQAVPLGEIQSRFDEGRIALLPLNRALAHIPSASLGRDTLSRLTRGQQEALGDLNAPEQREGMLRLLDGDGELVALAHWVQEEGGGGWRLLRVFSPRDLP